MWNLKFKWSLVSKLQRHFQKIENIDIFLETCLSAMIWSQWVCNKCVIILSSHNDPISHHLKPLQLTIANYMSTVWGQIISYQLYNLDSSSPREEVLILHFYRNRHFVVFFSPTWLQPFISHNFTTTTMKNTTQWPIV